MRHGSSRPAFRTIIIFAALALVATLAAGLTTSSDAALPFDNSYGGGSPQDPTPTLDRTGPTVPAANATKPLRASKAGAFTYVLGPFREDVRGTVSFATTKAVATRKKRKLSFGTRRFAAKVGKTARIRVKLTRTARKTLRRSRTLRIRARVVARDFMGNRSTRSFTFTLKRPR